MLPTRYSAARPRVPRSAASPQPRQDSLDHRRLFNQRDQTQPPTAGWARQHIDAKRPPHQSGPPIPTRLAWFRATDVLGRLHRASPLRQNTVVGRRGDQRRSPRGARGQHTVVQNQVDPRPRREHRQPLHQFQWIETQMRRAIRPAVRQPDLALTGLVQPLLDQGRPQPIATTCSNRSR
jgi:hypothetical protein